MTGKRTAVPAWIFFGMVAIGAGGQLILNLAGESGPDNLAELLGVVAYALAPIVFALAGALIIAHQPGNVIGLLLMLPAVVFAVPTDNYLSQFSAAPAEPTLFLYGMTWFGEWGWLLLIMPIFFILVLFPTGRPLSRRWRLPIYLGLVMSAILFLFATFAREMGPVDGPWSMPNPIGFLPANWFDAYLLGPWFFLLAVLTVMSVSALLVRYRRAGAVEREQIKWLLYAAVLFGAVYVFPFGNDSLENLLFGISLLTIPIAIGIAILRYRLFDIDIIIRKTVQYAALTAVLAAVYFGFVLLSQAAFVALTGEESPIAIVISTLVIAALFNPLRKRLQGFIDRRFYRRSYDAAQALAQFAQSARDEVEMEKLLADLSGVISETMQPEQLSLWLRSQSDRYSIEDSYG